MPALVPYVAAYSNELGPRESDLRLEVPRNGVPHIAYQHPRPDDRDAHGNLWARMTRPPEGERGRVIFDSTDPLRQRECMEGLLCQVCAKPAETSAATLFIEWQRPGEQPEPQPHCHRRAASVPDVPASVAATLPLPAA